MLLHIGGDVAVLLRQVVAIIDLKDITMKGPGADPTREFLSNARHRGMLKSLAGSEAKSAVVTDEAVYMSPISSITLKKRVEAANLTEDGL